MHLGVKNLEKLQGLLTSKDKEQVRSTFGLLYAYGDIALCEVLRLDAERVTLCNDGGIIHRLLWEQCILEVVCVTGNDWFVGANGWLQR